MMGQNSTIYSSDSRYSIGSPGWKLRSHNCIMSAMSSCCARHHVSVSLLSLS